MDDNSTPFPTIWSNVLGEIMLRQDDEAPWICLMPALLWPSRGLAGPAEVYMAGGALAPDARCLELAEETVLNLGPIESRCQSTLALNPGKNDEQEFFLMWLNCVVQEGAPIAEAVFICSSANVLHDDPYSLWIVTLRHSEPLSVRRDFW